MAGDIDTVSLGTATPARVVTAPERAVGLRVQIDGLRALAVLGVFYTHFWNTSSQLGHLGVRLFFVISGYLITGILLRGRSNAESGGGIGQVLKSFYARRFLRIFPAYYLALAFAVVLGIEGVRSTLEWHLLYASNVLFSVKNAWVPWRAAHLWTLSVEEQFYVVWPLLILMVPARFVRHACTAVIASAILFRACIAYIAPEGPVWYVLTPAALDALGAGALLATLDIDGENARLQRILAWGGAVGLIGYAVVVTAALPPWGRHALADALLVLPMAALVAVAAAGRSHVLAIGLANPFARYIGRISYGLYLYHFFVLAVILKHWQLFGAEVSSPGYARFAVATAFTLVAASLSWFLMEKPVNQAKRFFPYLQR